MSSQTVLDLVVGLIVVGLLVFRQLQSRPARTGQRLVLILLVLGVIETADGLQKVHTGPAAVAALAGSLVLAALFGALRAVTVRIWMQGGRPWVRGSAVTAVLWVAAIAAHLGYDYVVGRHASLAQLATATLLLYLVASLGVQQLVVAYRVQQMDAATPAAPFGDRFLR